MTQNGDGPQIFYILEEFGYEKEIRFDHTVI